MESVCQMVIARPAVKVSYPQWGHRPTMGGRSGLGVMGVSFVGTKVVDLSLIVTRDTQTVAVVLPVQIAQPLVWITAVVPHHDGRSHFDTKGLLGAAPGAAHAF
jgi:hypothetical protein